MEAILRRSNLIQHTKHAVFLSKKGMKQSLRTLSFIFILTFLSSSLQAQQTTTVVRVVDGDTLKVRYWEKEQ